MDVLDEPWEHPLAITMSNEHFFGEQFHESVFQKHEPA
jgi:hypothetical protein